MGRTRAAAPVRRILAGTPHLVEAGDVTDLNKLALVGTRHLAETPSTGTPLDELLPRLENTTPEARLLLVAGMRSVFRRAGYVPATVDTLPVPAPPETVPACSAGAARALDDMVIDGRLELLPEAFQLLARAGQRVPFSLLVSLLDLRDPVHREAAREVLGERGGWLARQRDDWAWARREVAPELDVPELTRVWHEGRPEARLDAIARLRELDAPMARDLLTASWKGEPADFRGALVETIGEHLSTDDEAMLLTALRDRAGAVRAAAAALLARLPDSSFTARAVSRADAMIAMTRTGSSGAAGLILTASPPERFHPEWEGDAISEKPPRGVGERAHWLMQAIALVDPSHWSARAGAPPSELTQAASQDEWGTTLMVAWSRAALSHGSAEWLVALWDAWLKADVSSDPTVAQVRRELLSQLFLQMPAEAARERVAVLLRAPALAADLDLESLLDRFAPPWPETLALPALDAIDAATAGDGSTEPWRSQIAGVLRAAGPAIPAAFFDRALALASRDSVRGTGTPVAHAFDVFAHQIRLRQRFHQEMPQ
jgi:hypothetical protein